MLELLTSPAAIFFSALGLAAAIATIGVALGQSSIAQAAMRMIYEQPTAVNEIVRLSLVGMALCETALLFVVALVVMAAAGQTPTIMAQALVYWSLVPALGLVAGLVGYLTSFPVIGSLQSVSRQPFMVGNISILMLITTLFIQTPILFGLMLCMTIIGNALSAQLYTEVLPLLAAACTFGLGCVGPLIGLALYARTACYAVGYRRQLYRQLFSFSIASQALIEAAILIATIIAFVLIGRPAPTTLDQIAVLFTISFTIGCGTCFPSIASGKLIARAVDALVEAPEQHGIITRTSLFCQVLIDTFPLYCLVISFMLLSR